jgi:diacylglycerol kinase
MSNEPPMPTLPPAAAQTAHRPSRHGLAASFRFAFAGVGYLLATQRNARIHVALAALACLLAAWLRVTRTEWAILILTIACVIILEGLNTALEAVVDLASPQLHPLAKVAKDVAAGMVLIAAIAAVLVGLLILGPALWARVAY